MTSSNQLPAPIGVMVPLPTDGSVPDFKSLAEMGLNACQVVSHDVRLMTVETAHAARAEAERCGIEINGFWGGWSGPKSWNFVEGPQTLGIVPPAYRFERMRELQVGARFAKELGAPALITHLGFIPENPYESLYGEVVSAIRYLARDCERQGLGFWFETGQETPVTLLRLILDSGYENLGINLDPANLLLYGKANAVDAVQVFGEWVRGVHAKDGEYPTDPQRLGKEKPIGDGSVNFPALIRALYAKDYKGAWIIEREIHGEQQKRDIQLGFDRLRGWLSEERGGQG